MLGKYDAEIKNSKILKLYEKNIFQINIEKIVFSF